MRWENRNAPQASTEKSTVHVPAQIGSAGARRVSAPSETLEPFNLHTHMSSPMTTTEPPPFIVQTCESRHDPKARRIPFEPPAESAPDAPFLLDDPFGLRKAILPVFRCEPGGRRIFGLGTATHVDGWGTFLTADHVVDFLRDPGPLVPKPTVEERAPSARGTAVLLLGIGVAYGTVGIPPKLWASAVGVQVIATEHDDPMSALRGGGTHRVEIDLCSVEARFDPAATTPASVPVNSATWQPTVGEYVFACGYPQLSPREVTPEEQRQLVVDGLYGCYGRITAAGRGGSGSGRECLFEVEADWPSGMSGGPVFNSAGEVVGVVSRSFSPDADNKGIGYAVCLSWVPGIRRMLPWLDPLNPGYRFGVAVLRESPWNLGAMCKSLAEAQRVAASLGPDFRIATGAHEMGGDGFVFIP